MYYKIGLIGSKELTIEEASTPEQACWNAGWDPTKCRAEDITEAIERKIANGSISFVKKGDTQ